VDSSFTLKNINNHNLAVGYMPLVGGFLADEYAQPLAFTFAGGFQMNAYADNFLAIDDQNRILMRDLVQGQDFMLTRRQYPSQLQLSRSAWSWWVAA
jgi:hypothetical protein